MSIQRIKSKWAKTNVLLKSEELRDHIPLTIICSPQTLSEMLSEFGMIYVKPDCGTFGKGVIRIERQETERYLFQLGKRKWSFSSFDNMLVPLHRKIGTRSYLIQRGIHILTYSGRRFDLRVMVQINNNNNEWESTGIIGRLSHPDKIITNYHGGGTLMSMEKLMSRHLNELEIADFSTLLQKQGVAIAKQLQTEYPRLKEIGIDIAVDTDLKPWILEVNTFPDPFIFRKLKDKRIFRKIYRYCKMYGRF